MAARQASEAANSYAAFGQRQGAAKMFRLVCTEHRSMPEITLDVRAIRNTQ
jgi:hypothetical protein